MPQIDSQAQRSVLVHVGRRFSNVQSEYIAELVALARAAELVDVELITTYREHPDPRYYIGSGKTDEIAQLVQDKNVHLVVFNHDLSARQVRNLEKRIQCRVIDRVELILDIFAQRAHSHEGKLQVELAQLQRLSTRLIRGWTHLERQKGGIGLRGPGETQLETDRRLLGQRIKYIKNRLQKLRRQRQQGRSRRQKNSMPLVALVGYTNSGKSTLFNQLTAAGVMAEDKLFATLDPVLRRVELNAGYACIVSDTVGFIRDIPHILIDAFRATLDEIKAATLLLHVIDASSELHQGQKQQVNQVLEEIGAGAIPQIEIYNKIDLSDMLATRCEAMAPVPRVHLSARTGAGIDGLLHMLYNTLYPHRRAIRLQLPPSAGKLVAILFSLGVVRHEDIISDGQHIMDLELDERLLDKLCREQPDFLFALQGSA